MPPHLKWTRKQFAELRERADRPSGRTPPVLQPAAGYPKGRFQGAFDPAMGRGYRVGDRITLAAGESKMIVNHGRIDEYFRWKVTLAVDPAESAMYSPNTSYTGLFEIYIKNENERIRRRVAVPQGGAQVLYAPGRSIEVTATNASAQPIDVQFSLDEATPGLSAWPWFEDLLSLSAETELDVPEFCSSLTLLAPAGSPGLTLTGYGSLGTPIYSEALAAPRSATINIVPGLLYTVTPVGPGAQDGVIYYQCVG